MARIELTRELAVAAGWDAANRSMRAAGRTAWNEDDYQIAIDELNRLWPLCPHRCEPGDCWVCDIDELESVTAIRVGLTDVEAGNTQPALPALNALGNKMGL